MKLLNIIHRATDFGKLRARKNFFPFALKCIFYIIPAIFLGNFTDITIQRMKNEKEFGDYMLYYILLQTIIIISTLYVILIFLTSYTNEFQVTIAGGFFSVLYFGIQTNYIDMIKEYINY
jgi:uncharacterized membrane protein (DUF485 family)